MGWLILILLLLPTFVKMANDPSAGLLQERQEARNLDCRQLSQVQAHELYPGEVAAPPPRGAYVETQVLVCERRIMDLGERRARDEAILSTLTTQVDEIAQAAGSLATPGPATWMVEAFDPDATVAAKVAFASRVALATRGLRVSDRTPGLTSDDVMVLSRMAPQRAYPAACGRYWAEGSMGETDVLLAVMLVDSRETSLHAGVCAKGEWRWLR